MISPMAQNLYSTYLDEAKTNQEANSISLFEEILTIGNGKYKVHKYISLLF